MEEEVFEISSDIPMPDKRGELARKIKATMKRMNIGQSFEMDIHEQSTAWYVYAKKIGMRVSCLRGKDGRVRCWRVA